MRKHPLRELVSVEGPFPAYADRNARALRQLVRVLPALRGRHPRPRDRRRHQRHSPHRRQAARRRRRDGLRRHLPAADPPDRRGQPQGPQQHARRRVPTTPARRGRSGQQGRRPRRHPPRPRRPSTTSTPSSPGPRELGLEVALDLALQAAPDHPWVTSHPEWFTTRADGTIAYAENPPKKYQDIYPVNFDNDPERPLPRCCASCSCWMSHGVRIFRVDNPHTKPVAFWEWLLGEVRRTDPDVLFLAEAFTRPAMMRALGAVGFHQSYTYFTWRTAKWELEEYLREVASRVRPHDAAQLLRQHPRHPPRVPAVRRPAGVQDPRRAGGHGLAQLGRLRRLRALRARGGAAGQRGVPRLGEVPDPRPRLGRRGGRAAARWRRTSPGSTRSAAHTPRCSCCATSRSTAATTTR